MRSQSGNPPASHPALHGRCRRTVQAAVLALSILSPAACDTELDITDLGGTGESGSGKVTLRVYGTVSSTTDGAPIGEAKVSLCYPTWLQFEVCTSPQVTGADGRYSLVTAVPDTSPWAGVTFSATGYLGTSRPVAVGGPPQQVDAVMEPLSSMLVRIWPAPLSLGVGESVQLSGWVTTRTGGYVSDRVTWSSAAPDIASVSASGLVSGVAKGTALITAVGDVQRGTAPVTVTHTGLRPSGPVAYVSASDVGGGSGRVRVIDVTTGAVVGAPIDFDARDVAVSHDGKRIYMTQYRGGVLVIDAATDAVIGSLIPTDAENAEIALSPKGDRAYVTHSESNRISVLDLAAHAVVKSIATRDGPSGIVLTPDGARAYVSHYRSLDVSAVDLATGVLVGDPIPMDLRPVGMAITPDGKRVLVSLQFSSSVAVIDVATNWKVGSIPVGTWPDDIAITPDGKRAYVLNSGSKDVRVIDLARNEVIASIPIGSPMFGAAVTPDGTTVFVTCSAGDVLRIDTASNTLVGTPIRVGFSAGAVAIRP